MHWPISDLVRSSARRGIALGEVALGAHRKGQSALAQRALDAAIQAATEKDSTAYPIFTTPSRNLDNLANYFLEQAYPEGAKEVLLRNNQLLPTLPSTSGFDWRFQAMGAIQLGDFEMASKALERVGPDKGHAEVQDALTAAKSGNIPVVQALQNAQAIVDPTIRARSLCDIAERQAAAGDKNGAAATFNLAEQAAEDIDQFQVLSLNDIAWAKIRAGDRRGAEKTLNSALLQNEMPALGTDQEDEWAILADTLAYLGHFELAHTTVLKISDRFYRGRGLGFLASRSVQAGRTQEMIAWSRGLDDPGDRCEAFLRIAEEMIAELKVPSRSETSTPYPAVFPNR